MYVCVCVCELLCWCVLLALSQTLCTQKPGGPIDLAIITRHGKWLLKVYFATARPLIRNDAFRTPSRNSKEMTKSLYNGQGDEAGGSTMGEEEIVIIFGRESCGRQRMLKERKRTRATAV